MKQLLLAMVLISTMGTYAQPDSTQQLRAFPITDYVVKLNDSISVVQVQMPDGYSLPEKQMGVLYGRYEKDNSTAVEKGYGRCNLIKGDYYYFTISNNKSGLEPKAGDLLYTMMKRTGIYNGVIPKLAAHYIRLMSVYDAPFYDRYSIFYTWSAESEKAALDSMISDIKFTGDYFARESPSMNLLISKGPYKGRKVLQVMMEATVTDLQHFFAYVIARPRLYAGNDWKISEIFATWLNEGAPTATTP